jgi:hypothetical protein
MSSVIRSTTNKEKNMSKALYVCKRKDSFSSGFKYKLKSICNRLVPDNIKTVPVHKICVTNKQAYAVSMHKKDLRSENDLSIAIGHIFGEHQASWHKPNTEYPDGSYAIFRNNDDYFEVVSDPAGSRTVWYYMDDYSFISSTSQRAIIMLLGNFDFDNRVIPWMLSTGTLGPELSWDKRIKRLEADSSVLLDKKNWKISHKQNTITFSPKSYSKKNYKELLTEKIRHSIDSLRSINFKSWVLPLSGGYDSRAILCFLNENKGVPKELKTVTWGLKNSIDQKGNDANIARKLADSLSVDHEYYYTNVSSDPIDVIIDRFIRCSEGRIDHISAYMDGMEMWRKFYDEDVQGVIRGDEGFGWSNVFSELNVRLSTGCALCSDFKNLKDAQEKFDFSPQILPSAFERRDNENLSQWRDRLYHAYRLPTVLAALSDIKYSYVEVINPLLSREVLNIVRILPDKLRTEKLLFKEIVNSLSPKISYADKGAIGTSGKVLRQKKIVDLIRNEIGNSRSEQIFKSDFIEYILNNIEIEDEQSEQTKKEKSSEFVKRIKSFVPDCLKIWLREMVFIPKVDGNKLAFRVFLVIRMHKILNNDSDTLEN